MREEKRKPNLSRQWEVTQRFFSQLMFEVMFQESRSYLGERKSGKVRWEQ